MTKLGKMMTLLNQACTSVNKRDKAVSSSTRLAHALEHARKSVTNLAKSLMRAKANLRAYD